jgi:7-cyano-7-deazaguanine synthase in queuosine biosynthesis
MNNSQLSHDFSEIKLSFNNTESDAIIPNGLVVLFSGGMDSLLMLFYAIMQHRYSNVNVLFINYGAPYNAAEEIAFDAIDDWFKRNRNNAVFKNMSFTLNFIKYKVQDIELNPAKFGDGYIIPLRNSLLISLALLYGDRIWLGAHWRKDDNPSGVCDKSVAFFNKLSALLSLNYDRPVEVWSPFLHMKKAEVLATLLNDHATLVEPFKSTVSCYNPTIEVGFTKMCGTCYSCWKSAKAYRTCNVMDIFQDRYKVNPFGASDAKIYEQREQAKGRL